MTGRKTKEPTKTLSTSGPFLAVKDSTHGAAKPNDKASKRAKQLINATAEFITLSLQPIRVVDEPSFRNLLSTADPCFDLPHRTHFSTKVIPDLYNSVQGEIEAQLNSVDYCTITTDMWTSSHQHRSYISLTIHFVDPDTFALKSFSLQTLEVPKEHTAVSLQGVLSGMFQNWGISSKVFGATADNGQNMVNCIELLGLEHFPCFAHTHH